MRIAVVGASKGTGALCVAEALARGHAVTAMARRPEALAARGELLRLEKGDFHDRDAVARVVKGQDAVIITAASRSLSAYSKNPLFFSEGTQYIVDAVQGTGARVVVLSALGVGDSRNRWPWMARIFGIDGLLKLPTLDHGRQEEVVKKAQGISWTIARPGILHDFAGKKTYRKETDPNASVPYLISRADVAHFLVDAATTNEWANKTVHIGG